MTISATKLHCSTEPLRKQETMKQRLWSGTSSQHDIFKTSRVAKLQTQTNTQIKFVAYAYLIRTYRSIKDVAVSHNKANKIWNT